MDNEIIKAVVSGGASLIACIVWTLSMRATIRGMEGFMLVFLCLVLSMWITSSAIDKYLIGDWVSFGIICSIYVGVAITPLIVMKVMDKKDGGF